VVLFAAGISIARSFRPATADSAQLSLHYYGDERHPKRISETNIWRWYNYQIIVEMVEDGTGKRSQLVFDTLFMTFDLPVKVGTLEVQSWLGLMRQISAFRK